MAAAAAFPRGAPLLSGALRPPVAVGPIDDDDYGIGYGGGDSPTGHSFRSGGGGGWSFPALQSDMGVASAYGGWGLPPSSSHGGCGGWDADPEPAMPSRGSAEGMAIRGNGWGGVEVGSRSHQDYDDFRPGLEAAVNLLGPDLSAGAQTPMLDRTSGEFGNATSSRSGAASSLPRQPGLDSSSLGMHRAASHSVGQQGNLYRSNSQAETPPQPNSPGVRVTQARVLDTKVAPPSSATGTAYRPQQQEPYVLRPAAVTPVVPAASPMVGPGALPMAIPAAAPVAASPAVSCPFCGNIYAADSKFCRKCGQKRPVVMQTQPPLALAEHWVASHSPNPVARTPAITYPNGCHINFQELAPTFAPFAAANYTHRPRMIPHIESGDLIRQALETYCACDRNLSGNLNWQNGEIQAFISSMFQQQGLAPPSEPEMYQLAVKFDEDRNGVLDARECVCLVDALFRAMFFAEDPRYSRPPSPPRDLRLPETANLLQPPSYLPAALPSTLSFPSTRAASDYVLPAREMSHALSTDHGHFVEPVARLGTSPYAPSRLIPASEYRPGAEYLPHADIHHPATSSFAPPPLPPALSQRPGLASVRPAAASMHPEAAAAEAVAASLRHATGSMHPATSIHPAASMHPGAASMYPAASSMHPALSQHAATSSLLPQQHPAEPVTMHPPASMPGRLPLHSRPPGSLPAPPQPEADEHDPEHVKIPHRVEDMGDGKTRRPPQNAPKPPAWHDIEEREHIIEVDLEELELHPDAPDLQPGFFESIRYFVSLHPRSEEPEHIPLPRDAPAQSVDRHYLVSQVQAAQMPGVQVGGFFGTSAQDRSATGDDRAALAKQNPAVPFKEKLELRVDKLDHYLVAYAWATKSSMVGGQTTTLVGRALAPLQEFKLQRRLTTWGMFDVLEHHRVAEMRLRYSVLTTPGPVLKPTSADVKQTEVTLKWSPPESDHGSPVIGYKVSILLDPKGSDEGPQWYVLCDCTKSPNPVYVVANLKGNTAYLVDVRAVNRVGAGDPCEFQITTAPVEPEPPSKPWIEEARDGCLNVAWHPPESDGGMQVTAFRLRMRKIIGASSWHPFGAGESSASWVEMGSVGAAMGDQVQQTMYNAWVGPLETTACEYRFQVFALNKVGESAGSELSEPYYT